MDGTDALFGTPRNGGLKTLQTTLSSVEACVDAIRDHPTAMLVHFTEIIANDYSEIFLNHNTRDFQGLLELDEAENPWDDIDRSLPLYLSGKIGYNSCLREWLQDEVPDEDEDPDEDNDSAENEDSIENEDQAENEDSTENESSIEDRDQAENEDSTENESSIEDGDPAENISCRK